MDQNREGHFLQFGFGRKYLAMCSSRRSRLETEMLLFERVPGEAAISSNQVSEYVIG